jgi:exosortase K
MRNTISTKTVVQLAVVLAIAFALKLYYSTAGAGDLKWVLAPTAFLVEIVTGERFAFESGAGYMNADHSFLIAAPCSGVNFLITAFLMLALSRLWKSRQGGIGWMTFPMAIGTAYVTTIVANTVRIAVAIRTIRMQPEMVWVNPEDLHRLEGIFIYFGFLLLLFVLSEYVGRDERARPSNDLIRLAWLPLLVYWAVTLGVPVLNGAYREGAGFWAHFAFVTLTPLILILPLFIFRILKRRPRRYA